MFSAPSGQKSSLTLLFANSSAATEGGSERPIAANSRGRERRGRASPSVARGPPKSRRLLPISASTASGAATATVGVNCVAHAATASVRRGFRPGIPFAQHDIGRERERCGDELPGAVAGIAGLCRLRRTMRGVRPPPRHRVTALRRSAGEKRSRGRNVRAATKEGERGPKHDGEEGPLGANESPQGNDMEVSTMWKSLRMNRSPGVTIAPRRSWAGVT
jgi:hypothetical protein